MQRMALVEHVVEKRAKKFSGSKGRVLGRIFCKLSGWGLEKTENFNPLF